MVVPMYPGRVFLQIKYNQTCFAFWKCLRLGDLAWNFFEANFWSRDVLGFVGNLRDFLGGFDF